MTKKEVLDQMQVSINALALEVPETVHEDVVKRWNIVRNFIENQTQEGEKG